MPTLKAPIRHRMGFFSLVVLITLVPGGGLIAQSQPSASLDLGIVIDVIAPGGKVAVPLTLTTSEDPKVGKASVRIGYPGSQLTFLDVTRGPALEPLSPKVRTDVKDAEGGEKAVEVEISTAAPMPQGLLLSLNFQIGGDVKPETEMRLRNMSQGVETVDGKKVQAYGIDGSIKVLEPAAPCFFYMH